MSKPISVLKPQGKEFESRRVFNPTVFVERDTIYMIYRAEGERTGSVFCLAHSNNAINFTRYKNNPILEPESKNDFEERGFEDERIAKFGDTYYLIYTGGMRTEIERYGGTIKTICLASSKDLIHWKKYGRVLYPKYAWETAQTKAGIIVPQKIRGKYWMYYLGEKESWHTSIGIAYSKDLLHWEQVLTKPVMKPRKEYWDSQGIEPGTCVVLDKGILIIYNGWDETTINKAGWALFSKEDPTKLIARCDSPIVSCLNNHVFATGLIKFGDEWSLYYGYADTWIERVVIDIDELLKRVE